jgi:cytochrome c biogenesis protein CcmG/thiol:disulfide interchange protein DsbE
MNLQMTDRDRTLCLHAAAKRLQMPERTLRYQASRGWIQGAFKQGKLWKFWLSALALPAAYLAAPACAPAAITAAASRKAAPGFTLTDSSGAPVRLSDYKGKVVLLNFWATWCHGCKLEIPWFMEFANRYKDGGLVVIGVSMDDDGWESVKPYVEQKKMNYPVVIGNQGLAKQYGLGSMPMTVLIDRNGKIATSTSGMVDKGGCESEIRTLLRE